MADVRTQLHGNNLKRQQPEPWEEPGLVQGTDRPLKRLRKVGNRAEAAVDGPATVPSSLEDSMSRGSNHQAGGDGAANREPPEQRGTELGDEAGDVDVDRREVQEEQYQGEQELEEQGEEEQEQGDNAPVDGWRANDTICTKCDDGGDLILCDGGCMRSFHTGIKAKEEGAEGPEYVDDAGSCNPLNMGAELFMRFESTNDLFSCPNCLGMRHQCFSCKQEGLLNTDEDSPDRIFGCFVGTCGRFYHAKCLDKEPQEMAACFVCPLHICKKCNDGETEEKGEVIPCRRCPKGYHAGCLPKKILGSPVTRVWISKKKDEEQNLLPPPMERSAAVEPACNIEQSLLYCMRHPMDVGDATPEHERALFPKALRREWAKYYAETYPDLKWSRHVMLRLAAIARARQEAADRRRLQAMQESQTAAKAAAPKTAPAVKRATVSKGAASAEAAAFAVPRRPRSANPKPAAASAPAAAAARKAARKPAPGTSDDDEIPLAVRIAAAKKKRPAKPDAPIVLEADFIPFEDTPADSAPSIRAPSPASRSSQIQSASASRLSAQPSRLPPPKAQGRASAVSVQAEAVWSEQAAAQGSEPSPAVPKEPPAIQKSASRLPSKEDTAEETPSPRAEAAAELPEDDMWTADADEEAAEADVEAARAAREAATQPDLEAAAAEAEAARAAREAAAAAAAAVEEQESFLLPCERESHWTRSAVQLRLGVWLAKAEHANPISQVRAAARMPKPYNQDVRQTISRERLDKYKASLQAAIRDPNRAKLFVDARAANEMFQYEDNLRIVLAPIVYGDRYTSYGRHFTLPALLEEVNRYVMPYLHAGDTVVDFSCGYNVWLPMLKRMCIESGWEIQGRAFDIITAKDTEDFVKESWLDVKQGSLPRGDQLVIGLNPPFGKDGTLANEFVVHAAMFRPRMIVLIVPPKTKIPRGYRVLLEDTSLMEGEAFFKPGADKASWNEVAPATRILIREDHFPLAVNRIGPHSHVIAAHTFPQPRMLQQMPVFGQVPLQLGPPVYSIQQAF